MLFQLCFVYVFRLRLGYCNLYRLPKLNKPGQEHWKRRCLHKKYWKPQVWLEICLWFPECVNHRLEIHPPLGRQLLCRLTKETWHLLEEEFWNWAWTTWVSIGVLLIRLEFVSTELVSWLSPIFQIVLSMSPFQDECVLHWRSWLTMTLQVKFILPSATLGSLGTLWTKWSWNSPSILRKAPLDNGTCLTTRPSFDWMLNVRVAPNDKDAIKYPRPCVGLKSISSSECGPKDCRPSLQ